MGTPNKNIYSPSIRKRKAYTTAFVVFMSYTWLKFKSKFRGKGYYDKRINALHLKNANRVKNRVQELQGLFIKFGQMISILSNVLPNEFRAPLEELQDHINPKPYSEVEKTIVKEFGKPVDELFSNFNRKPIAAASIGQVHKAQINGKDIVVKIQHHNIDTIAHADLEILKKLVKIHAFFMDMKGLDQMYLQVKQMIEEELDYTQEAYNMKTIQDNLKNHPELNVVIPELYEEFSSSKVLVSSFCEGTNMSHLKEIESFGIDMDDLATRLMQLYCQMVLVDGFYHADPHPGNILVNKKGEIILLDFGAVSRLSEEMKKAIPELIEAVIKNDTEKTVEAMKNMGFISTGKEAQKYAEKLIELFKKFLQEEVQLDGLNFQNIKLNSGIGSFATILKEVDLKEISSTIQIPKDYILLYRTIILLMGNSFQLSPNLDTINIIKPYMKNHMLGENGLTSLIVNTFKNQITTAVALPNQLHKYLKSANKGELEYEIKGLEKGFSLVYIIGQQFIYSILLIAGYYFYSNSNIVEGSKRYYIAIFFLGLLGFLLLRSFWKGRKIKF